MNHLTTTPILVAILAILYIVFSIVITKYILSNGKSENQIIESNKLKATQSKNFLKKYPEANLKSIRKFSLAFGFIFAFASSIYAFSLLGQIENNSTLVGVNIEPPTIFEILPPVKTEKTEVLKKVVPPPPPSTTVTVVDNTTPEPPEVIDPEPVFVPENKDIIFQPPTEIPEVEPPFFISVEEMPRFVGCEGVSKEEIVDCTASKIQQYISSVNYPEIAIDNDLQGKIYVSFTVNENGNVEDVALENELGNILDRTTLKHFKKMPKFASSGKQRGKEVKVKYTVPVVFKLD